MSVKNLFLSLIGNNDKPKQERKNKSAVTKKQKVTSSRIGEIGEYKINIQLDQFPKECRHLSDLMINNPKSSSGYSQIDHVIITPYGIFVIETKNYSGEIRGSRKDKQWSVSNRFKMYNPLFQNYGHIKALQNILQGASEIKFISLISFTMRCRFSIDPELRQINSDELIVYDVELSEFINRKILRIRAENCREMNSTKIEAIYEKIKSANIIDKAIRQEHTSKVKSNLRT